MDLSNSQNSRKQAIWTFLVAVGVALIVLQQAVHSHPNLLTQRPNPEIFASSRPIPAPGAGEEPTTRQPSSEQPELLVH